MKKKVLYIFNIFLGTKLKRYVFTTSLLTFSFLLGISFSPNLFVIGDGSTTNNKLFCINKGTANNPCLRYNVSESRWEASNDGSAYVILGSSDKGAFITNDGAASSSHSLLTKGEYFVKVSADSGTSSITIPSAATLTDGETISISRSGGHEFNGRRVVINSPSDILEASRTIDLWRDGAHVTLYSNGTSYIIAEIDRKFGANLKDMVLPTGVNNFFGIYDSNKTVTGDEAFTHTNKYTAIRIPNRFNLAGRASSGCSFSNLPTGQLDATDVTFNNCGNRSVHTLSLHIPDVQISDWYKVCVDALNFEYTRFNKVAFVAGGSEVSEKIIKGILRINGTNHTIGIMAKMKGGEKRAVSNCEVKFIEKGNALTAQVLFFTDSNLSEDINRFETQNACTALDRLNPLSDCFLSFGGFNASTSKKISGFFIGNDHAKPQIYIEKAFKSDL